MDPPTRAGQHADSGTGASAQPGTSDYDVLIVGCGPVGATLANYLRRYGHSVAIFDRDRDVFYAPRAMGFDRDSMRILNELGIVEQLIESDALRPFEHTFRDAKGRVLLRFSSETLGEDYLGGPLGFDVLNMVDQPHVERCLREAFCEWPQVHSYLGYEVVEVGGVAEDRAHVCVRNLDDGTESTFTGSYLVGCDGARSLVRQSIKTERIDLGYSEEWLVVDAIVDDADYYASLPDLSTFIVDADLPGIVAKGVLGHIRFDAYLPQGIDAAPGDIEQQSRELIARFDDHVDKFRIIRTAPYTFYAGTSQQWRRGRVFLAGDAAHQTPPFAGQGLNMGMSDAANLAFKIDLVLGGKASDSILDTYTAERQRPCIATIRGAVMNGRLIRSRNPLAVGGTRFVFYLSRHSRQITRLFWAAGTRKPRYRRGLVEPKAGASGRPIPMFKVQGKNGDPVLLDELMARHFALLSKASPAGAWVDRFEKELGGKVLTIGHDFHDPTGQVVAWLDTIKAEAALVRPDRYVFDAGSDADGLCRSLLGQLQQT